MIDTTAKRIPFPAAATVPTNGEPEVEQPVTVTAVDTVPLWAIIVSALVALASIVVLLVALLRRRTAERGQRDNGGDGPTTDPDEPTEPAASAPETELISQSEAERV
ncbi:hypothetical protein ACFSBZ_06705 [Amnibacterium flavum]|uniref:Uncharacterized protein n=1 Tax=Amnibacterium flavum TaxID=2173173 RepID=A0A2V1HMM1_9MICO|nr:hypothetical protein [Amnibacterium flavum]PVZ93863.1 hypothetical protein DDQ50_08770 [Amnibacterium flavum]